MLLLSDYVSWKNLSKHPPYSIVLSKRNDLLRCFVRLRPLFR